MPRQVKILINCDQCDLETDDDPTVIMLGRRAVETDLCATHREELEMALAPFLAKGHKPQAPTAESFDCPWGCSTRIRSKSGLSSHINRMHDGERPAHAPIPPRTVDGTGITCDQPGCGFLAKNALGISLHKSKLHGIPGANARKSRAKSGRR